MQMKKEQQNVQNYARYYTEWLGEEIHVREKARIIIAMNISLTT